MNNKQFFGRKEFLVLLFWNFCHGNIYVTMESISLGLKKLIFSKKDPPLYETSRVGRERNRRRQNNKKREGERDASPFEEVEARSFELTNDVMGKVSRNRHNSPDDDGARNHQDIEHAEKQENASGFEEIVWQDGDRATDQCKSFAQVFEYM